MLSANQKQTKNSVGKKLGRNNNSIGAPAHKIDIRVGLETVDYVIKQNTNN